jgi:hypothetical protein
MITATTLITDLPESGAADETIRDIAGHVSKQMLKHLSHIKHYSHIRMAAKRGALEGIVSTPKQLESGKAPPDDRSQIIELAKPVSNRRVAKSASAA